MSECLGCTFRATHAIFWCSHDCVTDVLCCFHDFRHSQVQNCWKSHLKLQPSRSKTWSFSTWREGKFCRGFPSQYLLGKRSRLLEAVAQGQCKQMPFPKDYFLHGTVIPTKDSPPLLQQVHNCEITVQILRSSGRKGANKREGHQDSRLGQPSEGYWRGTAGWQCSTSLPSCASQGLLFSCSHDKQFGICSGV